MGSGSRETLMNAPCIYNLIIFNMSLVWEYIRNNVRNSLEGKKRWKGEGRRVNEWEVKSKNWEQNGWMWQSVAPEDWKDNEWKDEGCILKAEDAKSQGRTRERMNGWGLKAREVAGEKLKGEKCENVVKTKNLTKGSWNLTEDWEWWVKVEERKPST